MKITLSIVTLIIVTTSLFAGRFDHMRPQWAPIEPDLKVLGKDPKTEVEKRLYLWAMNRNIITQYDGRTRNDDYIENIKRRQVTDGGKYAYIGPNAPNTLTEDEQAEVEELNRQIELETLQAEKAELIKLDVDSVAKPPVDAKQEQLDAIEALKKENDQLKKQLEDQKVKEKPEQAPPETSLHFIHHNGVS